MEKCTSHSIYIYPLNSHCVFRTLHRKHFECTFKPLRSHISSMFPLRRDWAKQRHFHPYWATETAVMRQDLLTWHSHDQACCWGGEKGIWRAAEEHTQTLCWLKLGKHCTWWTNTFMASFRCASLSCLGKSGVDLILDLIQCDNHLFHWTLLCLNSNLINQSVSRRPPFGYFDTYLFL